MAQKREILKNNEVNAPTLFVGVGGIGCDIVVRVAGMCKESETENINFVCLDTNVNDLRAARSSNSHIYAIQTSNTQTVGNYLDYDEDAFDNWFPDNSVLYNKTVSEGAGQVRAISRLAFNSALKMGRLDPLMEAIDDLFRKDGRDFQQAMRVVFVSSASGGTGSGIIMPLSMYIRDYVTNKYPTEPIIRALILLPDVLDRVITSTVEKESQRRNAYATIKEITAFMMKGDGFTESWNELMRFRNLHVDYTIPGTNELKRLELRPFDFCFLMDGQNANGQSEIDLEQYKQQAAMSLYEQNIGPMQTSAFSMEDNIIKEFSNPGNFGRNRYGGIGASVVRYPYNEVADFIAYQWVIDCIGGKGDTANWLRYDNDYFKEKRQAENEGKAESEAPDWGECYIQSLKYATDNFSKDLRNHFLGGPDCDDVDDQIDDYINALVDYVHRAVSADSSIKTAKKSVNHLSKTYDYMNIDKDRLKRVPSYCKNMQRYESTVNARVEKVAESVAKSVFYNEGKTVACNEGYMLESLFKNSSGDVCHPNAMRYYLYSVKDKMEELREEANSNVRKFRNTLKTYSSNPGNASGSEDNSNSAAGSSSFDLACTKKVEESFPEVCEAVNNPETLPSFRDKANGTTELYEMLNDNFPKYLKAANNYSDALADYVTYKIGSEYVGELCKAFEKFYMTFENRAKGLYRLQDDLVDTLVFTKGDSVLNVCATRTILDELCKDSQNNIQKSTMLDDDVNGAIFDAIKANVAFKRETQYMDTVEEDQTIDVFGDVLVGYYKDSVRRDCKEIDLNIIRAIERELQINTVLERKNFGQEEDDSEDSTVNSQISLEERKHYISDVIAKAARLGAPNIQRPQNEEPREVRLAAFNKSLLNMKNYNIQGELMPEGTNVNSVDSVSRYEIHFFNALYNLRPDKLTKFSCHKDKETIDKDAGLYHDAYENYSKQIGPDSRKNLAISTHIDRRWDSIAVLPELDLDFQKECMLKIHKAMIYGLVHKAIAYVGYSPSCKDNNKMVYRYYNSQERWEDLIVSNGTLCDEFYEILDALYIDPAAVEDIEVTKVQKREKNEVRQSNYADTVFKSDLDDFSIVGAHEDFVEDGVRKDNEPIAEEEKNQDDEDMGEKDRTSLFEIPLVYYNSLPNSLRLESELYDMVDATIQVFTDEFNRWESEKDAKFLLCNELEDQFYLLVNNYRKYGALNRGILPPSNNNVLEIIYSKIRHVIESAPEPDNYQSIVEDMHNSLK